jgi:hypothetical protein
MAKKKWEERTRPRNGCRINCCSDITSRPFYRRSVFGFEARGSAAPRVYEESRLRIGRCGIANE